MRARVTGALIGFLLVITTAPISRGAEYQIENLTNNANPVWYLKLNNVGQLAWEEGLDEPLGQGFGLNFEIFLYSDGTIHRISHNDWDDSFPRLNDVGQIAWVGEPVSYYDGGSSEIFLYDGSNIHQFTSDGDQDINPYLNNLGQVIWEKHYRHLPYYGWMHLFDGVNFHVLASSASYKQGGRLDDAGNAIWRVRFSGYDRIYYFDGTNIAPLTGGTADQWQASMNKRGQIVWVEEDGSDSEIFLWNDGVVTQITDNDYDEYRPILNELGQVAWTAYLDGTSASAEVFFFDGSATTQITNNEVMDWAEDLNINGHIVIDSRVDPTDFNSNEVFVYDGAELIQLTSNDRRENYISINDLNQVAWIGYGSFTNQWGNPLTDAFLANRIEPIDVLIDIKPGSDPNCFNNNGAGVIPVAILGSESFDVTHIDAASVRLASMQVKAVGKSDKLLASIEDSNGDGFADLIVKIHDEDGVFELGEVEAELTGNLLQDFDATPIKGNDSICIVP
jgi:hypothetical protein